MIPSFMTPKINTFNTRSIPEVIAEKSVSSKGTYCKKNNKNIPIYGVLNTLQHWLGKDYKALEVLACC